jgi:hypothetical protein
VSDHVEDQLPSLLLGDISPGAVRAILIHLRECPDCRDELVFIVIAHASLLCARPLEPRSARLRSTQPTPQI